MAHRIFFGVPYLQRRAVSALNPKMKILRKKAMSLPLLPGVYIMKNADGEIIYIGKAKALKTRQPVFRLAKSPSDKST